MRTQALSGSSKEQVSNIHTERARRSDGKGVGASSDFAHSTPDELLELYWGFVIMPMAGEAAILVSSLGASSAANSTKGDLSLSVVMAAGLQKAKGRNIKSDIVEADLGITVPEGFTPTFDLYLMAAKIRPETQETRTIAKEIVKAIRSKIRRIHAEPPAPPNQTE